MMGAQDPLTSIPVHQSTLRLLQRIKHSGETWDEFLHELTDDYVSPALQAELDARLKRDQLVTGAEARRMFEERRASAGTSR